MGEKLGRIKEKEQGKKGEEIRGEEKGEGGKKTKVR